MHKKTYQSTPVQEAVDQSTSNLPARLSLSKQYNSVKKSIEDIMDSLLEGANAQSMQSIAHGASDVAKLPALVGQLVNIVRQASQFK